MGIKKPKWSCYKLTELINERNAQHYRSNSNHALKPSDDDYRNKIYNRIVLTATIPNKNGLIKQ